MDANDFQVKLEMLKSSWDKIHSGFYEWFVANEDCFAHHSYDLFAQLLDLDSHLHCI